MAATTFHPFLRLPLEIREMIYTTSISPRVVHVQEKAECPGGFLRRFRSTVFPHGFQLDAAIAHFSAGWAAHLPPSLDSQSSLESYGFTNSKPALQPWTPTEDCPEIPLRWLSDNPEIAYDFLRRSELFSKAPLPALLHTCREARAVMQDRGYELTFGTRTGAAMTWFNYKIDTLYMKELPGASPQCHSLMSGHFWEIGQFMPRDLLRLERLALSGATLVPVGCHHEIAQFCIFLNTMKNLKELRIVEWAPENFQKTPESTTNPFFDCGANCEDHGNEAEDDSSVDINEPYVDDSNDYPLNDAIYKRNPWSIVAQHDMDEFLGSGSVVELGWDLTLNLSPEKSRFDQDHEMGPHWYIPLYTFVSARLERSMACHLEKPPRVIYSHIVPYRVDLDRFREWREMEMNGEVEEPSDYDFSGDESVNMDSDSDDGEPWGDIERDGKAQDPA